MTSEQFSRALTALQYRTQQMTGLVARRLTALIDRSRRQADVPADPRLSSVYWQLALVELGHRVARAEAQRTIIIPSPESRPTPS